ncbi:MAG: hypothetical protein ACM30H_11920 [Clostridia bacterium]
MTDHGEEESVSRRYRGLPREDPPARLDDAVRAHARRALQTHAAPLVPPTGRRSWAFPLAAAAVIVLAVAVTAQLEREQPDAELSVESPPPATKKEAARPEQPAPAEKPRADLPARRKVERAPAALPAPSEPAQAQSQAGGALSKQAEQAPPAAAAAPQAAPAARDEVRALARSNAVATTPEQWLERIAALRKEGRDDEADRQLAEFRKRYPEYRIAPEMLERVERRAP